jgi:cobalamin synthase
MSKKNMIISYIKAWNLAFEITLPISGSFENNSIVSGKNDSIVLYFFPIIGLTLGLFAYILSWLVSAIGGTIFASILCPFIIILSWELLNHAKDTGYLVHYLYLKIFKFYDHNSIEIRNSENNYMLLYIFTTIFIIRILCLAFFIYHRYFGWLVVVTVLTYAVQGHLAAEKKNRSVEVLISADRKSLIIMWVITAVLCLLFGAAYFPTMILAFIVAVLLAVKAKIFFEKTDSLSGANIGFTGKYTEIIILLLGLLFHF